MVISNREFREWQKKESFYLTRLIITPQQVKVGDQLEIEFSANDAVDEATTAVFIHTKQNTYGPFNVQKHENQKYTCSINTANFNPGKVWLEIRVNQESPLGFTYRTGLDFKTAVGGMRSETSELPNDFELHTNVPNPFNPETSIRFDLPRTRFVEIDIYNIMGQKIRTLIHDTMDVGSYIVIWDGRNDHGEYAASGIYLCRLTSDDFTAVRKMVLVQ